MTADRGNGGGGGDRSDAFDTLVSGSYRTLARLAYLMSGNTATAEDVVAEASARAWLPWRDGTVDDLGPYVRRTVVNLCLQGQRRRFLERRAHERFRTRPDPTGDGPGDTVAHRVDLGRALQALSAEHRAVVVLRFYADLSEQVTAELLGIPVGTVKSRTARAVKTLRPTIEGRDHV